MKSILFLARNAPSQIAIAAFCVLTPTAAMAQVSPGQAEGSSAAAPADAVRPDEVQEIVVTAQKRTERLIDVPVAVTAVSGASLAQQQINDTTGLVRAVPSLSYQAGNNPTNSGFRIRGIGTLLFGQGVEAAVGVVVDGVVSARAAQGFTDFADIERVEVLRGPQGTLFGKNATAGVLNIVTAAPSQTFGGSLDGTIAEKDEYRIRGTVTGGLTDTLSARVSGFYSNVGGYLKNIGAGNDANGSESWGVRGKLKWQASAPLSFLLIGEYREADSNCCSRVPISITTPALQTALGPIVATPDNRTISNDDASYVHNSQTTISLQGDYDLGGATITSITAYQRYTQVDNFEPDQIVSVPLRFFGAFPYAQWNNNVTDLSYDNWTQELRIGSNGSNRFTYVVGTFLSYLDLDRSATRNRLTCSAGTFGQPCTGTSLNQSVGFDATFRSKSASLFGNVDFEAVPKLHLLGGFRGQYEKQTVSGSVFGPLAAGNVLFPGSVVNSGRSSRDDTAFTGRAGVRYEINRNTQVYGTFTRGYKAFALDIDITTNFANNRGLAPEHVNAYELGFKWRAPNGLFDTNIAAFRSDYSNLQTQATITDPTTGGFVLVQLNAGKSRSQGVEFEATVRPSSHFSIPFNITYLDATIDSAGQSCPLQFQTAAPTLTGNFPVNSCYRSQRGSVVSGAIIDVQGGRLPLAPKWRLGISPRLEGDLSVGGLGGFVQANVTYLSKQNFAVNQDPLLVQKAYTLVNMSAGIHDASNKYTLTLFVNNLFDKTYFTQLNHGTILSTTASPNDVFANVNKDASRYFGATVGVRF